MFLAVPSLGDDARDNDNYNHNNADKIHCFKKSSWRHSLYRHNQMELRVLLNPCGDQRP